jgi:hypothetical protein
LPEDKFVNTFHFSNPFTSAALAQSAVRDFYLNTRSSTRSLGYHLSPSILRNFEIRVYNLGDPEPRVPQIFNWTLPTRPPQSSTGIPEEAAVCLSFHGAPPRTARRRGRIYFGPMGSTGEQISPAGDAVFTRVTNNLIDDLIEAGEGLLASNQGWAIRSTVPTENFVQVTGGWVDNRLDTQRRRGPEPLVREVFGA